MSVNAQIEPNTAEQKKPMRTLTETRWMATCSWIAFQGEALITAIFNHPVSIQLLPLPYHTQTLRSSRTKAA